MKKLLAILLAILMLTLPLASCNKEESENADPTEAPATEGVKSEVTTAVKVVYAAGTNYKKAALKIQDKIMSLKGASLDNMNFCQIGDDSKLTDDGTFEILFGLTNRALSAEVATKLTSYLDYAIIAKDNKIAVFANNETRMVEAANYVASKISLDGDKVVYSGKTDHVEIYSDYSIPDLAISSVAISEFSIVYAANAAEFEKNFAATLADWLMSTSGATVTVKDDSAAPAEHEILIGKTNRAESADADSVTGTDYKVAINNGKLTIFAATKSSYDMALSNFKSKVSKTNSSLEKGFGVRSLTFDQIKEISVGSPNIKEENNALYFYKATDEQMEAYGAPGTGMRGNATGSTGVRLDFTTDSSIFTFKAAAGNCFELYINGEFKQQYKNATSQAITVALDNSEGENRVTLFLPNDGVGAISMVQLDSEATCERQVFDYNFLIIGDSITQAWPTDIDSYGYGHLISMNYNADSIVYGVGGGIFDAKILGSEPECTPDLITVAFGTNDWARGYSAATIEANMKAFLDKLIAMYPDAKIVGITPLWRKDAATKGSIPFDEARAIIARVYAEYGITCIDGDTLVSHADSQFADDVHPNDAGHQEYAENLIKELDKILLAK